MIARSNTDEVTLCVPQMIHTSKSNYPVKIKLNDHYSHHHHHHHHQQQEEQHGSHLLFSHNQPNNDYFNNSLINALDALPKPFVVSMKTLFDILDDQHSGFVKFSDIEKGWKDDGSKGLPFGVIDSLQKVTPASGLLSFERFCAGLKLCLVRNQSQLYTIKVSNQTNQKGFIANNTIKSKEWKTASRPQSIPSKLDFKNNNIIHNPWQGINASYKMTTQTAQRAHSLPQLSPDSEGELTTSSNTIHSPYNSPPPPPKPPRASIVSSSAINKIRHNGGIVDRTEIRQTLQNWQLGILRNEMGSSGKLKATPNYMQQCGYRGSADGGSSSATDSGNFTNMPSKKSIIKRREPRRHTLQNGIDYNMLKRLKQYEEERELLLLGLEAVNKAKEWYMQQLVNVQEKIKCFGLMSTSHMEQWSEVQEERLNFQKARVFEVNRSLSTLPDTWERSGFPLHFNLAIRTPTKSLNQRNNATTVTSITDRLRQQNRLLTSEVHLKTERIAILERERQTLLGELFDLKQRSGLARHSISNGMNALSQTSPGCSSSSDGIGDADVVY